MRENKRQTGCLPQPLDLWPEVYLGSFADVFNIHDDYQLALIMIPETGFIRLAIVLPSLLEDSFVLLLFSALSKGN